MHIASRRDEDKGKIRRQAGTTLVEVLVALLIGATVAAVLTLVTSTGLRNIRSAKHRERLHANAIFISDALAYWVKQGVLLTVPSPSTLEILLPDSSTKTIAKSGNRVTLGGNALTSDDVAVTNLAFIRLPRSVRISFTVKANDAGETFSATTTVAQRNTF